MSRFRITAHMKAPIIFGGGYATLDALLAALLFTASTMSTRA
jgi:hypothetical protein